MSSVTSGSRRARRPAIFQRSCVLVAGLMLASVSQAGTELHLRSGTIQLNSAMMEKFSNATAEADYLIQFNSPIVAADQALLKSNNIKVLRYVPDDAYIVRGKGSIIRLSLEGRLTSMSTFEKSWKLAPVIVQALAAQPFQVDGLQLLESSFDVMAFNEADGKRIEKILNERFAFDYVQRQGRFLRVTGKLQDVIRIAEFSGVENIEPTAKIETMLMKLGEDVSVEALAAGDYTDLKGYESGTKIMNFDSVWSQGFSGSGQIASMADTGLDSGVIASLSADFTGAVTDGLSAGIGAKNWSDPMGHGTHVSGSIVGRGGKSGGLLKGGAFGAGYYPEGMWSPLIDNLTVPPQLNKLFEPAFNEGARVHSNSWGSPRSLGDYDAMASQVDEYTYQHPEFLVVFAAGNSGVDKNGDGLIDPNSISSPGTAKNSLTVGASENLVMNGGIQKNISELRTAKESWPAEPIASSKLSDNADGIACFSSRGPTADNRLKPEIVAPGTNILSTRSHIPGAEPLWGAYNDEYVWSGGTSMATPLVSGAAVVAREILAKKYSIASPSAALVKALLMNSAKDLFPGQYGMGTATQELQHRPDSNQGYGLVDMDGLAKNDLRLLVIDEKKGLASGQAQEFTVTVPAGRKLTVNMVYTDPQATPASGKTLVNDLDLEISGPGGTFSPRDRVNNHEIVEQSGLSAGTYKVKVFGQNVPMGGSQPFALIATVQ